MSVIILDLDGCLFQYDHYTAFQFGDPMPGVRAFLEEMQARGHTIRLQTTRADIERDALLHHLDWHNLAYLIDDVQCGGKLCGEVYIDDRAVRFAGDWNDVEVEMGLILREKGKA